MLWNLLFCHHWTNFNCIFMVFRVGFQLWMFSNERLSLSRAFHRVLLLFCGIPTTLVMSEKWIFFKSFKTFKNSSILLITRVVGIPQKSNSTLWKALDNGNLSLENIQSWNPTLKTIKMQLKLVRWWQTSNFQSIFLYYLIIYVFFAHKL